MAHLAQSKNRKMYNNTYVCIYTIHQHMFDINAETVIVFSLLKSMVVEVDFNYFEKFHSKCIWYNEWLAKLS